MRPDPATIVMSGGTTYKLPEGTLDERMRYVFRHLPVAGSEGARLLFVTGVPLREPVFQYGPFVMTTRDEIVQAVEDFRSGKFGEISAAPAAAPAAPTSGA